MAGRLQGKVALVTAAGQEIGRAIAKTFIAEGAITIATDVDPGKVQSLKAKKVVKLDVHPRRRGRNRANLDRDLSLLRSIGRHSHSARPRGTHIGGSEVRADSTVIDKLLVAAIARGRRWLNELTNTPSMSIVSIANAAGCSLRNANMTISLAFLAPDLVNATIEGRLLYGMKLTRLCELPAGASLDSSSLCPIWQIGLIAIFRFSGCTSNIGSWPLD